jgi:anti-sigma B factor antagonist
VTGKNSSIRNVRWIGRDRGTVVVEAVGDVDLHRSAGFQQELLAVLDERPKRIVVDLSGVGYMDSSGVASLVKLLARVRREQVSLKLTGLTPRVRSVFEITRLDTVFEIFPTQQEALES